MVTIAQQQRHRIRAYHQRQRWIAAAPQRREERAKQRRIWWEQARAFFDNLARYDDSMATTTISGRLARRIIEAWEAGEDE